MTTQEIFDIIAKHLLTQNKKSTFPRKYKGPLGDSYYEDVCAYRGDNGLKCAVGALIKDECYNSGIETKRVNSDLVLQALECSLENKLEDEDLKLLTELQYIHDAQDPKDWKIELSRLAAYFKLSDEVVNS
jgi:hypothetical protein